MAEIADRTVSDERAALAETRRRIGSTLDAIDGRVRPPAAQVSHVLAGMRGAHNGLELVAAGVATASRVRDVVRTVRALSKPQQALIGVGTVGLLAALLWVTNEWDRGDAVADDHAHGLGSAEM
jgi:hypothetical protein